MKCRTNCGACCIAPSISSPLPGMAQGKPAGIRCIHLDDAYRCILFGSEHRPKVCSEFTASPDVCGFSREQAMENLLWLEANT